MRALTYEARRLGWLGLAGPPLTIAALCFFGWLAAALGTPGQTDRILSAIVQVASLTGGMTAVAAVAADPAIELRLSLPTSFRQCVSTRIALALIWAGLISAAATQVLHATQRLTSEIPGAPASDQLEWLSPMLLLAGAGALASVASRTVAAGAGLVAGAWVLENVLSRVWLSVSWLKPFWIALPFDSAQPNTWYWNRVAVAASGLAALAVTAWLLGRPEHLLGGER